MAEKPTRVRHVVLFVVCLVYLITYLDRINIAAAAPMMMKEFNFSKAELGAVFSAFTWAYALFQIPAGWLGDKYGARKVLALVVVGWSVMTSATAFAWSFTSLLVIRFIFGIGEAGAFPSATRAFSFWIPATERGLAQGLTHAFARFGAAITPAISVAIIALWGWRTMFVLFAGLGIVWAACWYFWYRDKPTEYREKWGGINEAEIELINEGKDVNKKKTKLPFAKLFRSKNMWALCLAYFCYSYTMWIYYTWLPTYLIEARGFTIVKMGIFASMPLLAGTVGDTLGGWLSDRIWAKTGRGKFSRRIVAISGLIVGAAFMIPGAMTDSAYLAVFLLSCSVFALEMSVGVYWAVCLDVGHEFAGTVSGMMNSIGNIGSALSPLVFGIILQSTGSWVYPFLVASVLLLIGSFLWLKVDPETSVAAELGLEQHSGD
ncbi:MAG: MFS transporter [Negativicutes bacterium]|nr:MFS transporter [Negativicutes bacterium]